MSQGYNGWTNYETWCVNVWMTNEQESQAYLEGMAEHHYREAEPQAPFTWAEQATLNMAALLKSDYEDEQADILEKAGRESSVWADLLGAALSEVNWHEIAKAFVDGLDTAAIDAEMADEA